MKIIIMRHGQAVTQAASDSLRGLTDQGYCDASEAGKWLMRQPYHPDLVLVSPYLRARQTAAQVLIEAPDWKSEIADWITPEDSWRQVIQQLDDRAESVIMLVSHQPLVGTLLEKLVDEQAAASIAFTPATIAVLEGEMVALQSMQLIADFQPSNNLKR